MKHKRPLKPLLGDLMIPVLGNFLYGAAIRTFLNPNKISVGGFAGLGSLGEYLWQIPTGIGVLALNIPLLLCAFFLLKRKFFFKTLGATVLQSLILDLVFFLPPFTENKLLAALTGGFLSGLGLGMIFSRGMATGGSDLLAKLLRKPFPAVSYGRLLLCIDGVILLLTGAVYGDLWAILYSALTLWISSTVIDHVLSGPDRAKSVTIVTENKDRVLPRIFEALPRGATAWTGSGGYTGQPRDLILTVVRNYELFHLKRIVKEADPDAFLIVSDASEVLGRGFRKVSDE